MQRLTALDTFNELMARDLIKSLLGAVCFMHEHDVVHRDIKFNNIIFCRPDDDTISGAKLAGDLQIT